MTLTDWTLSTQSQAGGFACQSGSLDAAIKYAGNSSLKLHANEYSSAWSKAVHNTWSDTQLQAIVWVSTAKYSTVRPIVKHSSYGNLTCVTSANSIWERFKVSFWYDPTSNLKWGRVERWDGGAWVQIGSDTNHGTGSPSAGNLTLMSDGVAGSLGSCYSCWFDELEVYS